MRAISDLWFKDVSGSMLQEIPSQVFTPQNDGFPIGVPLKSIQGVEMVKSCGVDEQPSVGRCREALAAVLQRPSEAAKAGPDWPCKRKTRTVLQAQVNPQHLMYNHLWAFTGPALDVRSTNRGWPFLTSLHVDLRQDTR